MSIPHEHLLNLYLSAAERFQNCSDRETRKRLQKEMRLIVEEVEREASQRPQEEGKDPLSKRNVLPIQEP